MKRLPYILTIGLFFFYRFFNLPLRLMFDWDQETLAFQMKGIIQNHDLILIGHRATDAMGFYFGPYFEYLFVPFYFISHLSPFGVIPFIVILNIVFLCASLYVVRKIFGTRIALGFLFLWAINPLIVTYDITIWAPIVIPLGYLLTLFTLWRIYYKPSFLNFLILGLVLGFFTQIHSLFFFMDLFAALFLIISVIKQKCTVAAFAKRSLVAAIPFLAFFAPLALFDIRHDFLNLRLFFGYFSRRAVGQIKLGESLDVFANFFRPLTLINMGWGIVVFYIVILVLFVYLVRHRNGFKKVFYSVTMLLWLFTAIILVKLTQRPSEYYFLYLYPLVVIALLDFFSQFSRRAIFIFCALFFISNFFVLQQQLRPALRGLHTKSLVVKMLKERIGTRKYSLSYDMPAGLNNGYEYLLDLYAIEPTKDEKDPMVILRLPAKTGDIIIDTIGIRIPKELTR